MRRNTPANNSADKVVQLSVSSDLLDEMFRGRDDKSVANLDSATQEEQLQSVGNNGTNIFFIDNPSGAVQLAAVQNTPYAIAHISRDQITPDVKRFILNKILLYIKNDFSHHHAVELYKILKDGVPWPELETIGKILKTRGIYSESTNVRAPSLSSVENTEREKLRKQLNASSEDQQIAAVRKNPWKISYIQNPSEQVQLAAVEFGRAIIYIKNPSEKVVLAAIDNDPWTIELLDRSLITPQVKRKVLIYLLHVLKTTLEYGAEYYNALRKLELPWPELDTIARTVGEENLKSEIDETSEVDAMRKMKIMTQVDIDETEGLYNTTVDRWSRRAKHHLSKSDIANASETSEFYEGENAFYKGREVEVRIPIGPNGTAGVMLEGHLRMVDRKDLSRLEEGVLGGLKPLTPINRIMQLAGLEHTGVVVSEDNVMEANESGTMFNQLYQKNVTGEFKNNSDAARTATIGQLLASMQSLIEQLPDELGLVDKAQLKAVPGIGASLIAHAKKMIQPNPPGGTE